MPEQFVTVYLKDTGEPARMHSVDAAEAVRIGDYVSEPPYGEAPSGPAMANAQARAVGIGTNTHPELQTPAQREEARRAARETALLAARPTVVVTATSASVAGAEALANDSARLKADAAERQAKADADAQHAKAEADAKAKADAANAKK